MTASISAASGLTGLPGPTGRGVQRGVAWLAQCEAPLGAHGTSSKARSYFYPRERLTVERPNTIGVGKVQGVLPSILSHAGRIGDRSRPCIPRLKPRGFLAHYC